MIEDYNTYILNRKEIFLFCSIIGTLLGFTAYLFYDSILISILFVLLAWPARKIYSNYLVEKQKGELVNQFRDLLYSLSSSISSGRQMREALVEAEEKMKLTYGVQSLICRELSYMVTSMMEGGDTEETVLKNFANRSGVEDIMDFVDVYSISKRTGADMERVIRKTVGVLIDRIEIDREVKTLTAQKRFEIIILAAMPLLILLFLKVTSGSYLEIMYQSAPGRFFMSLALMSMGIAVYAAYRMTQIRL